MFKDIDLKYLSNDVYNVEKNKTGVTHPIKGKNYRKKYHVTNVEDNQKNGFQGMAVVPIKHGKSDYSHITISFAGTNSGDQKDIDEDVWGIAEGHRKTLSYVDSDPILNASRDNNHQIRQTITVESQFESALKFYQRIHAKYPNAKIDITGHSLGGAIALLVASHYHVSAKVFSAPDPWKVMTNSERLWALANPESLMNFRHHGDWLSERDSQGMRIDGFTGTTIWCKSTKAGKGLGTHMLATFEFKDGGQIKVISKKMGSDVYLMGERMGAIEAMAKSFKKSGGEFTHSEKIALDSAEAVAMADSLSRIAEDGIEQIIKHYNDGIDSFEENWMNTVKAAEGIGVHLSQDEIMTALEKGGITYKSVVQDPTTEFNEKISNAKKVKQEYIDLSSQIKTTVDNMIATDKELAGMFK